MTFTTASFNNRRVMPSSRTPSTRSRVSPPSPRRVTRTSDRRAFGRSTRSPWVRPLTTSAIPLFSRRNVARPPIHAPRRCPLAPHTVARLTPRAPVHHSLTLSLALLLPLPLVCRAHADDGLRMEDGLGRGGRQHSDGAAAHIQAAAVCLARRSCARRGARLRDRRGVRWRAAQR
jgi:hypothetical protein